MEVVALLLLSKSPFEEDLHQTTTNRMVVSDFTMAKKQTIEADTTRNMVKNKTTNGTVVSQVRRRNIFLKTVTVLQLVKICIYIITSDLI